MVARALAERRNPAGSVYMDGRHNPTPVEVAKARELVSLIRTAERNHARRELLDELEAQADDIVWHPEPSEAIQDWIREMREGLE
jgi:hypothetical protein